MTDPSIIEAAARALVSSFTGMQKWKWDDLSPVIHDRYHAHAKHVLTAVTPLIEAAIYRERNQVVAALARLFPSGLARTDIPEWEPEWHGCVYIDLPTGQVSWHYHDDEAHLFKGLPTYTKPWDGHDTPEKYRRLAALSRASIEAATLERAAKAVDELDRHTLMGPPSDFE